MSCSIIPTPSTIDKELSIKEELDEEVATHEYEKLVSQSLSEGVEFIIELNDFTSNDNYENYLPISFQCKSQFNNNNTT